MIDKKKQENKVTFRRIGGRIVPITVSGVGAATALSAANTKRIYTNKKSKITIDKKLFSIDPGMQKITTGFDLRKDGKKAAVARTYMGKGNDLGFAWLGVSKDHRNRGLSKLLSKEAVREGVRKGAKTTTSQVIHEGSVLTNFNKKRDSLWYNYRTSKDGSLFLRESNRTEALKHVGKMRVAKEKMIKSAKRDSFFNFGAPSKKKSNFGVFSGIEGMKIRKVNQVKEAIETIADNIRFKTDQTVIANTGNLFKQESRIFRETNLKGIRPRKAFRTRNNKISIALGTAAFLGGLYGGIRED